MGAHRLAARTVRKIARETGLPLVRGWGHGGHVHGFVTADHQHIWYDKKSGEWGFEAPEPPTQGRQDGIVHYASCHTLFHHSIPEGTERLKMIIEPGLLTLTSLRHYRDLMTSQAYLHRSSVADGYVHARWGAIGPQVVVVLERRIHRWGAGVVSKGKTG